ncbi:site-specific DNA-methyltransferase [Delftia sp. S67]|nr:MULTISPECIES: site-specific DNA-methyltransferase [unclassified Delftia]MBK0115602.1 site-specific DNA-methyltransferase [Delftia sp. S65]MBK0119541.1 site-specific DNA-methyltransferase [Delftia sp. S67]MBK0130155.1 site-specific DNA-methyltransferase [Delftia sp. S66]
MNTIEFGDCRDTMRAWAAQGVRAQMCVTSPPYFGLRDYGHAGQLGLEQTPEQYIAAMVEVFRCVRDVLADDGTLWLNIGDSYASRPNGPKASTYTNLHGEGAAKYRDQHAQRSAGAPEGLKHKDLIGIPWMLAFALRADGWYLRQDIIWHKPNPMPESVADRCTKAHEYLFLLSKGPRYFFDSDAMQEPAAGLNNYPPMGGPVPGAPPQGRLRPSVKRGGFAGKTNAMPGREAFRASSPTRNRRSVWTVATRPYKGAHFATFPPALIEPCIRAGSRPGDVVLDPFMGSGTTAAVALQLGRQYLGCELNPDYEPLQRERIEASAAPPPAARTRRRATRPPEPEPAQRGLF